jgi:hypothetical protein
LLNPHWARSSTKVRSELCNATFSKKKKKMKRFDLENE